MPDPSQVQKQRLSSIIDKLFLGYAGKARLLASLAGHGGDYSVLAEMSDSDLVEMVTFEKELLEER